MPTVVLMVEQRKSLRPVLYTKDIPLVKIWKKFKIYKPTHWKI